MQVGHEERIISTLEYRSDEKTQGEPQTHHADEEHRKESESHTGHDKKVESRKERWGMQPTE